MDRNVVCLFLLALLFNYEPCLSSSVTVTTSRLFQAWSEQHGKSYSSEQERLYRLRVFEDNHDFVTKHNGMGNSTFTLSLNAFADLTHHEFKATRLGFSNSQPKLRSNLKFLEVKDVPDSVDWRTKGAVTNVKDQGSCGACWSFSATGAMEGINKIVTGSLISLSEQELIDCDTSYNTGCNGGLMDPAYKFVVNNHGIDSEDDYPFVGSRGGSCNKAKLNRHVVTVDGYTDVPENNEAQLLLAVAKQPVSVGICGSEKTFQFYSKGIFTGPCSCALDHAVLIVGYGSENGMDYWIVKNSWGTKWGMSGYIHMQRNIAGNSDGMCGINSLASYPTKTGQNPPPSPAPGPSKCSAFTSCNSGETCCCASKFFGMCFSWSCCGLGNAVCCDDHRHCCPHDYPICDTRNNKCYKRSSYKNGTIEAIKFGGSHGKSSLWGTIVDGWVV